MRFNRTSLVASLAITAAITLSACMPGVNGSVYVADGSSRSRATTVNGSVHVGDDAHVGEAKTVNGSIRLGDNVTALSVKTVNGGVRVGNFTKVKGDVKTVNGGIVLYSGADISGDLATVNGSQRLERVHVGGELRTVNGSLFVGAGSHIEGGIHVLKPRHGPGVWSKPPRIVIGPDATVDGTLRFEQKVKLFVSDRAHIGAVEGATPLYFSGDRPGDDGESTTVAQGGVERADRLERLTRPDRFDGPERP